jgi:hypothetical protein
MLTTCVIETVSLPAIFATMAFIILSKMVNWEYAYDVKSGAFEFSMATCIILTAQYIAL